MITVKVSTKKWILARQGTPRGATAPATLSILTRIAFLQMIRRRRKQTGRRNRLQSWISLAVSLSFLQLIDEAAS
jgi:hypothetical protein